MEIKLEELKKHYAELQKKNDLPSFDDINEVFEIEKIDRETEILPKLIRRLMMDRVINVLGFIEMLMNPAQAPRMYHSFLNVATDKDQKLIGEIYEKLAKLFFEGLENDSKYDEKKEILLIKRILSDWEGLEKDLEKLVSRIKDPGDAVKKDKAYFG